MRRREFIAALGGAALAMPLAVRAQQPVVPVIGFLSGGSPNAFADRLVNFREGLSQVGYFEYRNVGIDYRWAEGQYDRLPALAADLARKEVTAIVANTSPAALAAKAETTTIPIVFTGVDDPVKYSLVASLSRPGGNVTGVSFFAVEVAAKRLGLLHELVPNAAVVAMLVNPHNPTTGTELRGVQETARALKLKLHHLEASVERDFDTAFAALVQERAGSLLIGADPFFATRREELVARAARYGVPAMYFQREFAAAGGLVSYGTNFAEAFRQVGIYTGRILKGEKPADLPVMQPTKFELVVNLKTAKALGLEIPAKLLALADEVIE
jgi:putative tryptophan/tyrosine transport system substrate-binding protein